MAIQTKDFSVSALTADGTNTLTYVIRITEEEKYGSNGTRLTVQAILQQSKTGTCFQNKQVGVSCVINGQQIFSSYTKRTLSGTQEHIYYTKDLTLTHENDGTLQLKISGSFWTEDSASLVKRMTATGTMDLVPISSTCTVGASDAKIGANSTIVIADNPNYTHSIRFLFGSLEGYIQEDGSVSAVERRITPTVISFPIPETFYEQIPDAKSGYCRLRVRSYQNGSYVGETQTSFSVTTDKDLCAPLLSAQVADCNPVTLALTGDENRLVRFFSQADCRCTAQGQNFAQIQRIQVNGLDITDTLVIPETESGTFSFVATDTRGYQGELVVDKELIPYIRLTCNPRAKRTAPTTGQVALTLEGNCWNGNFGTAENTLSCRYRVDQGQWEQHSLPLLEDHTYQHTLLLEQLDYATGHAIDIELSDALSTVTSTVIVQRGIPVFDWGEDYFNFHVPVHFDAGATGLT